MAPAGNFHGPMHALSPLPASRQLRPMMSISGGVTQAKCVTAWSSFGQNDLSIRTIPEIDTTKVPLKFLLLICMALARSPVNPPLPSNLTGTSMAIPDPSCLTVILPLRAAFTCQSKSTQPLKRVTLIEGTDGELEPIASWLQPIRAFPERGPEKRSAAAFAAPAST